MTKVSKFQFKGYHISKSIIELRKDSNLDKIKIGFKVSGLIHQNEGLFQLNLAVKVTNKEEDLNILIEAIGEFKFESIENTDEINTYFYNNSTAILFPYLRAHISTLTNLSGNRSITLPTMNLSDLANELKANTKMIDHP